MNVLFPSNPLRPSAVDDMFADEHAIILKLGLKAFLVPLEELGQGRLKLHGVDGLSSSMLYRGWMLPPEQYAFLHKSLYQMGLDLVNNPSQYNFSHNFPEWYTALKTHTPESIWFPGAITDTWACAQKVGLLFGSTPVVIKDYLKSQKHYWHTACYIPDASDIEHSKAVMDRFIELQGSYFTGGLVVRQYVPFAQLGKHAQSDFPIIDEYRAFLWHGRLLYAQHMWDSTRPIPEGAFSQPLLDQLAHIPFLAVDVALGPEGKFHVIEVGDGGTSSVPSPEDFTSFYTTLKKFRDDEQQRIDQQRG
jgi:hypothetical protein